MQRGKRLITKDEFLGKKSSDLFLEKKRKSCTCYGGGKKTTSLIGARLGKKRMHRERTGGATSFRISARAKKKDSRGREEEEAARASSLGLKSD